LDVHGALELGLSWLSRAADLHKMDLLGCLGCLFLAETEDIVLVSGGIGERHVSEAAGVTLEDLLLLLLEEEELHPGIDGALVVRIEPDEKGPLLRGVHTVGHDLAVCELLGALKDS
jgi:hypothetical protein